MAIAPSVPRRSQWRRGADQRSLPPRTRARAAMTRAESSQRTTERLAGPKASAIARPITGLSAKQAGTRASRRKFIEGGSGPPIAHCRQAPEAPSLPAIATLVRESDAALRVPEVARGARDSAKPGQRRHVLAHRAGDGGDRARRRRRHVTRHRTASRATPTP